MLVYNNSNNISSFNELLQIGKPVSVDYRNIKVLATELYKAVNCLSLKLVKDCFKLNNTTAYKTKNRYRSIKVKQNLSSTRDQKFGKLCQVI